jgi:hypothetical protein
MDLRPDTTHTRAQAARFFIKTACFKARRCLLDLGRVRRFEKSDDLGDAPIRGRSVSDLWTGRDPREQALTLGKIQNLRQAARSLNGVVVPAGKLFSFWAHIGRPTRSRGYAPGRELREGCIIPSVGGGLCQLSNALYDAALHANFEVVERHAHSKVIPGSLAEKGRDATVFWNYVDLRFRSNEPFRIEVELDRAHLTVRLRSRSIPRVESLSGGESCHPPAMMGNCITCNMTQCFRHAPAMATAATPRRAYLVDEYWPEFDQYIQAQRREHDILALPLDGLKFRKSNYAWSTSGFEKIHESRWLVLRRALLSRRLADQGASRQLARLSASEHLARSFASRLHYEITHVTVMQNLLPYLWREGHLAGRSFDVLMTSLPMAQLHARLDEAYARHPQSPTLGDFRAPASVVADETAALCAASRLITPHTDIAKIFPEKTTLLDWALPLRTASASFRNEVVVFPGPGAGRRGIYELREALRGLDLELALPGRQLEGCDFWNGCALAPVDPHQPWHCHARTVVCPAWVEGKPRRLLEAAAMGRTVIASTACGVENVPGIISIPFGEAQALRIELEKLVTCDPTLSPSKHKPAALR